MTKPCVVPRCKTGYKSVNEKCSVFKVPSNIERQKKWQAAIPGIVDLKPSQYVCEKHFEEKYIQRKWIRHDSNGRILAEAPYIYPKLDISAVPSIFDSDTKVAKHDSASVTGSLTDDGGAAIDISMMETFDRVIEEPSFSQDAITDGSKVMGVDDSETSDLKSPDDGVLKVQIKSIESNHNQQVEIPAIKHAASQLFNASYEISSKVSMSEIISTVVPNSETAEKIPLAVPSPWGVSNLAGGAVGTIMFSLSVPKMENGVEIPVLQKSVTVSVDKTLRFFVHGRAINAQACKLAQHLDDTKLLPKILDQFKNVKLCHGLGAINVHRVSGDSAFKDQFSGWHSNDCTMISKNKRCDDCIKMRRSILKNEMRSKSKEQLHRIRRVSNPVDQRKILALRKKNLYQKRQRNRAKR